MTTMDGLIEVLFIVGTSVLFAGGAILFFGGVILMNSDPKPKAKPDDGLRKCRGCGATFHKSWIDPQIGRFCPNCIGAD